jgi:glutaredoxin 3
MGNSKVFIVLAMSLVLLASAKLYSKYEVSVVNKEAKTPRSDLKVLLYTKDTCKYCIFAKELLDKNTIPYELIELGNNRDLHQKMADQTGQNTVPYVYVNGEFIGGYKNLQELEESGKLYLEPDPDLK